MPKIMLRLAIFLFASHGIIAARIKHQSQVDKNKLISDLVHADADTAGALTKQTEADSAHDRKDSDDLESGASMALVTAPVVTDHAAQMQTVAEYAIWVFNKAMSAYSVYSQWNAVKLALNEAALAANETEAAFWVLAEKVKNSTVLFASSGLRDFSAQVNRGLVDRVAMEGMFERHPEGGEAEFLTAMSLFRSCSIELQLIAVTCDKVIQVIDGVKQLTGGVTELTDAWVDIDLTIFDSLKTQVTVGKDIIRGLVNTAETEAMKVHQIVSTYLSGAWDHGQSIVDSQIKETFGDLGDGVSAFQTVFELVVEPLVVELAKGVRQLVSVAQRYRQDVESPDNVADEDMNYYTGCAWRNTRYFDDLHDVDIEKTMVCEMEWFGRYKCSCIGMRDCYVSSEYRPAGATQQIKRCFKEVYNLSDR